MNSNSNSYCARQLIRDQLDDKKRNRLSSHNRVLIEAKLKDLIFNSAKKPIIKREFSALKQVLTAALTIALSIALISDLSRILKSSTNQDVSVSLDNSGPKLTAWASWIGAVPTAAELYGDAASEMPTTESFDDDEDDEELDASASNEYPDNDNESDESYEDPDEAEQESEQESRNHEHWLKPIEGVIKRTASSDKRIEKGPDRKVDGHAMWADLEGWRRNKRDLEDKIMLASRRAVIKRRAAAAAVADKINDSDGPNDEFNVDDGDEDSWVNDGVDDIHIDPETKKAASELSMDEKSIDAEYDPHQKPDESKIVNRTRITTIAEVIPMNVPSDFGDGPEDKDSTKINSRFLPPIQTMAPTRPVAGTSTIPTLFTTAHLLPASHLSIDQAQELVAKQAEPHFWSSSSNMRATISSAQRDNPDRLIRSPSSGGVSSYAVDGASIDNNRR